MKSEALAAAVLVLVALPAHAVPQYSVQAAKACNTCHIEPTGWKNPELKLRRCSLDCSGCHVSSTGGGMRTPSGEYYGLDSLATWGIHPSAKANPEKYRAADDRSTPGNFRLWRGFSGWWPGAKPVAEIPDRYGDGNPDPRMSIGGDFRFMSYTPLGPGAPKGDLFPMQADVYLMGKVAPHLRVYSTVGYLGKRNADVVNDRIFRNGEHAKTVVAWREVFVKANSATAGMYVRAGRMNKPHGWRVPDHTTFVRREEGFDQNSQAFGLEGGFSANYPYGNVMLFYQGSDDWPGDLMPKGTGAAVAAGYRALAGQIGFTAEGFQAARTRNATSGLMERRGAQQVLGGPIWAVNAYPVLVLGEVDLRSRADSAGTKNSLFAYDEIDVSLVRGLSAQLKYDYLDADTNRKQDHRHRYTAGLEWNPYNHIQLLVQHRWSVAADEKRSSLRELILMTHAWF